MKVMMGMVQANVVQIGNSCGVVIEFRTDTFKEAQKLREILAIAVDVALKTNGGISVMDTPTYELDGMTLHEIFDQIAKAAISSE